MPSPICTPLPLPLLIPAPCMVCCHHIISARRFCLTSEVNGRRTAERARVELSRELSLAARLPQGNAKHRDCHSSSGRPATCILRSLQQQQQQQRRSSAAHPTLQQPPTVAWFGCQAQGIKWKVKRELQPSFSLHPLPFLPCPSATLWCSFDVASPSASSSARHHRHRRRRPRLQLRLWIALFSLRGWACSSRRLRDTHRAQIHTYTHTHLPGSIKRSKNSYS